MKTKSVLFRISEEDLREAQDFISDIREAGEKLTLSELIRNGIQTEIEAWNTDSPTAQKRTKAIELYETVSRFFP